MGAMKLSMTLNYTGDPVQAANEAADLEKAGIDMIWVAELYSFDAVSILGFLACLLYTSPSPRDATLSRMPSSA